MGLHGKKNLKTAIQKNLSKSQKFARKVTVVEFRYSQTNFFFSFALQFTANLLMIIWKLLIQSLVKQLRWSSYVENLLTYYSSKKIWGVFHQLGFYKGDLNSTCLLIILIYTKHKTNKIESWTHPARSFPWVTPEMQINSIY